ncbi:MAG: hypothetical protein IKJ74_05025 [Clostridia bacterium]|nr:hypothetical protein [Clostridia bacterium]
MWKLRHYHSGLYRARYGRYRIFFFLSVIAVVLFLLGEIWLYGAGGRSAQLQAVSWQSQFRRLFTLEAVGYLVTFLCGITIYAPFVQFLACGVRGVFYGYLISCLVPSFSEGGLPVFILFVLYALFSVCLYCSYASFCTQVSLRIYTDPKPRGREEERIFGGTLFRAALFSDTVNLRFLFTYVLLFLCAFFSSLGGVFFFSLFRSWLG